MYTHRKNIILVLLVSCAFIVGIIYFSPNYLQRTQKKQKKLPNDVRWVVNSDEYVMLCRQIYKEASIRTKNLYSNKKQAIIMDLDETILDNSTYQIENFNKGKSFNMESWGKWVNRAEASLVPGTKEYINLVRKLGIQLIFISNRMDTRVEATKKNMKELNIYNENDIYLLRLDKADKKDIRRDEVLNGTNRMATYSSFDVIVYIGDAMGDFPKDKKSNNFILPNPMYGKW